MSKHGFHPSLLFITPTGIPHREMIRQKIADANLSVLAHDNFYPSERVVIEFFGKRDRFFLEEWKRFVLAEKCEILVVGGQDAISRLIGICGTSTVPHLCLAGTIRSEIPVPSELVRGEIWCKTPVFPARSRTDLLTDLRTFEQAKFLKSSTWNNGTH